MIERILLEIGVLFMCGFSGRNCGCNPARRGRFQMLIDEMLRDEIKKASPRRRP